MLALGLVNESGFKQDDTQEVILRCKDSPGEEKGQDGDKAQMSVEKEKDVVLPKRNNLWCFAFWVFQGED